MRYFLIVNSKGDPKRRRSLDDAINAVAHKNPDLRTRIEFRFTEYSGHAAVIASELVNQYKDRCVLICCGGDGTVHEIANVLAYTRTPMLVLPFGTGNDFAKTVIPDKRMWKMEEFLLNLDNVQYKPMDMVRIDSFDLMGNHIRKWSAYTTNVASIGLDTKVQSMAKAIVAEADTPFNRKTAYFRSALRCIVGRRSNYFSYRLELEDGTTINSEKNEHTLIAICNAKYYGDGFCPAPDADISDGVADVCCVDAVSLPRALFLLALYKFGKHRGRSGIHIYRAVSGVVTSCDPSMQVYGNYDGEDFYGNRIRFEIQPKALRIGTFS